MASLWSLDNFCHVPLKNFGRVERQPFFLLFALELAASDHLRLRWVKPTVQEVAQQFEHEIQLNIAKFVLRICHYRFEIVALAMGAY